jgi:hypothetical protein
MKVQIHSYVFTLQKDVAKSTCGEKQQITNKETRPMDR